MRSVKLKKWIIAGLSATLLTPVLTPITQLNNTNTTVEAAPDVEADSAIIVDFDTMQILYDQEGDEQRGIASMTKMLVEYILFEEIEAGNISWDTEVTISEYAHQVSQDLSLSNVPLQEGASYTIQELYESLAIYSANGSTIAIAEAIEGSEPEFVDRMRELVESWGIENAQLYNTTGLNNANLFGHHYPDSPEDAENMMSAKEMAMVAVQLLQDYPEVLETASVPTMTFRPDADGIEMTNWNWMLEGLNNERPGVDGLKTGTTSYAGATFTGTAEEEGRRLVTVIMGAGDGFTNRSQRFEETDKLFDYGFNEWRAMQVMESGLELDDFDPIEVKNGVEETVSYETAGDLEYLLHEDYEAEDIEYVVELDQDLFDDEGTLEAPVEAGTEVGRLVVTNPAEELGYLAETPENTVPVITSQSVERAGWFSVARNWFSDFWSNMWDRF